MKKIRSNVFETNSSSVHSIAMCSVDDYKRWKDGELLFARWEDKLIAKNDVLDTDCEEYLTYDQFKDIGNGYECLETFCKTYITPNGENVVAFGYYGHD